MTAQIQRTTGSYGSARHPARDAVLPGPGPRGPGVGANETSVVLPLFGASRQSIYTALGMGAAGNTASPMNRTGPVWAGTSADPSHRLTGRLDPVRVDYASQTTSQVAGVSAAVHAIRPVSNPFQIRFGAQAGPSSQPAYPSTGQAADFGAPLAWMSLAQVANPGMRG